MEEKRIEIEKNGKISSIKVNDIILCVADGNNSDIYTTKGLYKTIRLKIGEILDIVNVDKLHNLRRVGNYYLMNLDAIADLDTRRKLVFLSKLPKPIEMPVTIGRSNKRLEDGGIVISSDAMKQLLLDIDEKKRRKILSPLIINKLNLPIEELNTEHLYASGNEYVDLGLPSGLKWSIRNLGAHPAFHGGYYQWNTCFSSDSFEKDCFNPEKGDCVNKLWGDNWHMPSKEDFKELEKYCFLTWCVTNRKEYGCLITGRNGNRLFLPAFGWKEGTEKEATGIDRTGSYWTSDVSKDQTHAESFVFSYYSDDNGDPTDEIMCYTSMSRTSLGNCIRPVIKDVQNPTQGKKLVLIVNNYSYPSFHGIEDMHILNCKYCEAQLPAAPEKALASLRKWCNENKPDFIIGHGTGCFFVHQLNGYKRMCVNPEWYPSKVINIEEFDGIDMMTPENLEQFAALEKTQFDAANDQEPCWMVFDEGWWNEERKFCEHYNADNTFEIPELKCPSMVYHTFIYPLVMELW